MSYFISGLKTDGPSGEPFVSVTDLRRSFPVFQEEQRVTDAAREVFSETEDESGGEGKLLKEKVVLLEGNKRNKSMDVAAKDLNPPKRVRHEDPLLQVADELPPHNDQGLPPPPVDPCFDDVTEAIEQEPPVEVGEDDAATDMDEFVDIPLELAKEGSFEENTRYFAIRGTREGDVEFEIDYRIEATGKPKMTVMIPQYHTEFLNPSKIEMVKTTFTLRAIGIAKRQMWRKFEMQQITELLIELIKLYNTTFKNGPEDIVSDLKRATDNLRNYILNIR